MNGYSSMCTEFMRVKLFFFLPFWTAKIKGVLPLLPTMLTSAPFRISSSATLSSPKKDDTVLLIACFVKLASILYLLNIISKPKSRFHQFQLIQFIDDIVYFSPNILIFLPCSVATINAVLPLFATILISAFF